MTYVSITTIKNSITEIMSPLMERIKKDTDSFKDLHQKQIKTDFAANILAKEVARINHEQKELLENRFAWHKFQNTFLQHEQVF